MAKQHVAEQETLGEAMNRTELFFEKNGRNMAYIFWDCWFLQPLFSDTVR